MGFGRRCFAFEQIFKTNFKFITYKFIYLYTDYYKSSTIISYI